MALCIELTLVDLSNEQPISNETLSEVIAATRAKLQLCDASRGHDEANNDQLWNGVENDIMRYIKVQDRYLALSSLLLKSRAYHQYIPSSSHSQLPVVSLLRTRHKKPYIPSKRHNAGSTDTYPLSISHQYPFTGCVQYTSNNQTFLLDNLFTIGLDIVIFDSPNPKLYGSVTEFCEVFQSSFHPTEYAHIMNSSNMLHELYLRWVVKEAYTKALGVGLGFGFSTFAVHLNDCLYETLATDGSTKLRGTIEIQYANFEKYGITETATDWMFIFYPLLYSTKFPHNESALTDENHVKGYACVSIPDNGQEIELKFNRMTIDGLISYHLRNS